MTKKKLIDFTIEEAVNAATKGFGDIDTEDRNNFGSDSLRHALQMIVDFKLSQKQDEINSKLLNLTKWLVGLTIALVILTVALVFLTYKTYS